VKRQRLRLREEIIKFPVDGGAMALKVTAKTGYRH
jgi:hypothetical protein